MKRIDLYGQLIAVTGCFFYTVFKEDWFWMMSFYFVVGGWQFISMLLNLAFAKQMPLNRQRINYQKIVFVLIFICIFSFLLIYFFKTDILAMPILVCLLFGSPFLAIWYFNFSYKELKMWEARDQVHFK